MYKEAQRHRAVLPKIARQLFIALRCNSCPCAGYVSIRPSCASMRRRSSSCWLLTWVILKSFLLSPVQCLSVSALQAAPATACPWAVMRVHAPPCAPMRLNSRPCGSMHAHASFSGTRSFYPLDESSPCNGMKEKRRFSYEGLLCICCVHVKQDH